MEHNAMASVGNERQGVRCSFEVSEDELDAVRSAGDQLGFIATLLANYTGQLDVTSDELYSVVSPIAASLKALVRNAEERRAVQRELNSPSPAPALPQEPFAQRKRSSGRQPQRET